MRLLQVTLRGLLIYSIIILLISVPVSFISIQAILNEEVDESIEQQADQFIHHIKGFEYLDDLETDLKVLDQLSSNIHIKPSKGQTIEKVFSTISVYDSAEHEEKPVRQLTSSVVIKGKPYILTVEMSLIDNDDLVMAIGLVQVALSILLTAGLLLLNRSLSKKLWKPFYKTLDQLKAYELDKSESISVEKSDIIEFNDLNKAINQLTDRNRKVFLDQKEFIENASHELQTPIAIFQSKLDSLMQSPGLSQSEAETIMELESTAQRMARLNKNLLFLSKIDNDQFLSSEEIDLSALIENQLHSLRQVAGAENLKINTALDSFKIRSNKTLIEVLLTNLFHNAIRHSYKGEDIEIKLSGRVLSISNKGNEIKMKPEKMIERFSKESSDPNSTGLGLAIVKKICDKTGCKLDYQFKNSTHTFSVTF